MNATIEPKREQGDASGETPVIVGVGASAGGLEAFQDLFARLTDDHKLAMVLVQHLDPDHESLLQELLSKRTPTPVHTITDAMRPEPGNIYLIPPGRALELRDGMLRLVDFVNPRGQRRPIDTFFCSLADHSGASAVGIILSGTGSDGSAGIRAIKAAGGLVFAQDPAQARYDGMPRSAIKTGAVDLVLRTEEMPDALSDYFDRRLGLEPAIASDRDFIDRVFKHVRYHTGHDFTHYKMSTLMRRLALRMSILGIVSPAEYVKMLIADREEARRLIHDVLINVTAFFRDPEVWDRVRDEIIPQLVRDRSRDEEVRIWVPACSTGQEAYTLAMLVAGELSRTSASPQVAIFGTDIDDVALSTARRGLYPQSIADEVPPEFLQSYFTPTADGFEIGKALRNMVRFSPQSLVKDPPFSKIDLITCRNLSIYFEPKLQNIAASVFHYALKPGGFLVLGLSENPVGLAERFELHDPQRRIFRRNAVPARPLDLPFGRMTATPPRGAPLASEDPAPRRLPLIERELMADFVPPYVLIGSDNGLLHAGPGTERFLRIPMGDQKFDILSLVIPSLQTAIRRVIIDGDAPRDVQVALEDSDEILRIRSRRVENGERYITFECRARGEDDAAILPVAGDIDATYVRQLENELDDARQTIRTTIEELETTNEELKSSNEEMMSMNEELQSSNEELSTINDELLGNVSELNDLNADLSGFIESTGLATVFLDDELRLRRFTPRAKSFFRFQEEDLGRPIQDFSGAIDGELLVKECREAIWSNEVRETEVMSRDGERALILRIAPRMQPDLPSTGLVFTLVDVTDLRLAAKEAEAARIAAQRQLAEVEELYRVSPIGMALLDHDLRFLRVNQRLADYHGIPADAHIGFSVPELFPHVSQRFMDALRRVRETGLGVFDLETVAETPGTGGQDNTWIVDIYPLKSDGETVAIGMNVRNVTAERQTADELRRLMLELQHRVKNMLANVKALINRARRDPRDPKVVLTALSARVDSMARTHDLLTAQNWQSTDLHALARAELSDVYGAERIVMKGPQIRLNARASLALGLTIHELATNAAKYGALSEQGRGLDLRWMRLDEGSGDILRLIWTERVEGGVRPPEDRGFGSNLMSAMIEGTLEGGIALTWADEGLICTLDIPFEHATNLAKRRNDFEP